MSIYGVCDINVSFRNFRNIDLYHQGSYYLRTQVYIPGTTNLPKSRSSSTSSVVSLKSASSSTTTSRTTSSGGLEPQIIPSATRGSRDTNRKELKKKVIKHLSEGKEPDDDTRSLCNPQPQETPIQMAIPHRFQSNPITLCSTARGNPVAGSDNL